MRQIKFRAWSYGLGRMLQVKEIDFDGYIPSVMVEINSERHEQMFFENTDYPDCELMQYTGLKDMSGQEIYEGDIVKVEEEIFYNYTRGSVEEGTLEVLSELDYVFECIGPIKFENGGFWIHDLEEDRPYYLSSLELNNTTLEITGNIYENKELLND